MSEMEKKGARAQMFLVALLLTLAVTVPFAKRSADNSPEFEFSRQPISAAELVAYRAMVDEMVGTYTVRHEDGVPVVHPPAGSDIYILARNYDWGRFILELERGASYRLHLATADVAHAIIVKELKLKNSVEKGLLKTVEFKPDRAGRFPIVCGEFCGTNHGSMTGLLIVTEAVPDGVRPRP